MQDFRQWRKSKEQARELQYIGLKWCRISSVKSKYLEGEASDAMLEERQMRGRLRNNIARLQASCIRYGEDSETRRLGSVGGSSQRPVNAQFNAQSTLQPTLQSMTGQRKPKAITLQTSWKKHQLSRRRHLPNTGQGRRQCEPWRWKGVDPATAGETTEHQQLGSK